MSGDVAAELGDLSVDLVQVTINADKISFESDIVGDVDVSRDDITSGRFADELARRSVDPATVAALESVLLSRHSTPSAATQAISILVNF
ncbi:hypothetical protein SAMN05444004_114114 [Jannaschia faecimaris]|uniref:Uncharacterized protein n=1 Tax=Jannaschia faecimaris TaxID=1244108 RepID=A0A1H3T2L9_9RHOB|nr:hypothetical protein SAMN05444004_114114 [Jannaschia faecimaris]